MTKQTTPKPLKPRSLILTDAELRTLAETGQVEVWREMKVQPPEAPTAVELYHPLRIDRKGNEYPASETFGAWGDGWDKPCLWGTVGATVMVKEAFALLADYRGIDPGIDALSQGCFYSADLGGILDNEDGSRVKWRSGATMPPKFVRTKPTLTTVRVEQNAAEKWCWVGVLTVNPAQG